MSKQILLLGKKAPARLFWHLLLRRVSADAEHRDPVNLNLREPKPEMHFMNHADPKLWGCVGGGGVSFVLFFFPQTEKVGTVDARSSLKEGDFSTLQ